MKLSSLLAAILLVGCFAIGCNRSTLTKHHTQRTTKSESTLVEVKNDQKVTKSLDKWYWNLPRKTWKFGKSSMEFIKDNALVIGGLGFMAYMAYSSFLSDGEQSMALTQHRNLMSESSNTMSNYWGTQNYNDYDQEEENELQVVPMKKNSKSVNQPSISIPFLKGKNGLGKDIVWGGEDSWYVGGKFGGSSIFYQVAKNGTRVPFAQVFNKVDGVITALTQLADGNITGGGTIKVGSNFTKSSYNPFTVKFSNKSKVSVSCKNRLNGYKAKFGSSKQIMRKINVNGISHQSTAIFNTSQIAYLQQTLSPLEFEQLCGLLKNPKVASLALKRTDSYTLNGFTLLWVAMLFAALTPMSIYCCHKNCGFCKSICFDLFTFYYCCGACKESLASTDSELNGIILTSNN